MKEFILPKDIPLDRYPKPEVFLSEGKRIVDAARQNGFAMRVMGPLALHYYFPEHVDLYARLERLGERYFTDIDFVAYSKSGGKLKGFFEKLGYECDVNTLMMTGKTRQIYYGGAVPMIDVFLDKLDYCHEVSFKDRLEFDDYSISLTDITLQKLQIWEINDKDLKDLEFLLTVAEHRRRRRTRRSTARTSPSAWATTGASGTRPPRTSTGSKPTSTAFPPSTTARRPTSSSAATSCWRASKPSPRPRTGRSGPRRAPTRSGTTPTSPTGEVLPCNMRGRAYLRSGCARSSLPRRPPPPRRCATICRMSPTPWPRASRGLPRTSWLHRCSSHSNTAKRFSGIVHVPE